MTKQVLDSGNVARLQRMINKLDDGPFGQCLRLCLIGSGISTINVDTGGWIEIKELRFERKEECELARKFCEDYNAATAPIRERLVNDLRQILANECMVLGAAALEGKA